VNVRTFSACELVTVRELGPSGNAPDSRFLIPFDTPHRLDEGGSPKWAPRARWQAACRALLTRIGPSDALHAAVGARIQLLPYQLEPALAIVAGLGARVLLADEVGLGKTIQASLIVAELRARAAADRVLILTPAGLRDQWAAELRERFGVAAFVADSNSVRRRVAELPVGVNPWSTLPLAIASLDYVKRPEVLPAVEGCRWDVVVIDEAHGAATSSERQAAAAALCGRAPYVLLLSATPHSGDRRAFQSLCSLGAHPDDRILVWRRRRADLAVGRPRRIHRILVRLTPEERRMHVELTRIERMVRTRKEFHDGQALALSVLCKRAYSSAHSLAGSIDRRLAALGHTAGLLRQLDLPLADDGDFDSEDEPPVWAAALAEDAVSEQRLLSPLAEASAAAARDESKIAVLLRLLRRLQRRHEPAIVFTEFRDTLLHLARRLGRPSAIIHGGMPAAERRSALADFTSGRHSILLATDAAAEGLNLHATCRAVINLELPWNPMRIEQRIGRVDRIGQHRTVHAFHLIANETGEVDILGHLQSRLARAREDVDTADPLGFENAFTRPRWEESLPHSERWILHPRMGKRALEEQARIATKRLLGSCDGSRSPADQRPPIVFARRTATRALLAGRMLVVFEVAAADADGRHVAAHVRAVLVRFTRQPTRKHLLALVPPVLDWLEGSGATKEETGWRDAALAAHRAFWALRSTRESALAEATARESSMYQPGLFDRRTERRHLEERHEAWRASERAAEIIGSIARAASVEVATPRVALVLLP
jgi:superfamily II DNA or RNA helicase